MTDESITAAVDPDHETEPRPEGELVAIPEAGSFADELDDVVWDAFGSGLSTACD
jgi:hypothetical protein